MTAAIKAIKEIIAKLKRDPELAVELPDTADILDGVGLDSLEMLQFMLELEERLAIRIDFDKLEFSYLHSIRTLAEFLETMPSSRVPASAA